MMLQESAAAVALRSAPVRIPSRSIFAAVAGPTPWNLPTGSAATKSAARLRRDDELAVGLALVGGQLGEELVVGDAGRGGQPGLRADAGADFLGGLPAVGRPRLFSVTSR